MRARVSARGFTEAGVRITQPSWRAIVEALGCPAARVTTRNAFDHEIARWRPAQGPAFIEAVMPERPYVDTIGALRE
jgi:thiamine pyrophosphate-dependent acetolactate synthase large subunit-like protein